MVIYEGKAYASISTGYRVPVENIAFEKYKEGLEVNLDLQ